MKIRISKSKLTIRIGVITGYLLGGMVNGNWKTAIESTGYLILAMICFSAGMKVLNGIGKYIEEVEWV